MKRVKVKNLLVALVVIGIIIQFFGVKENKSQGVSKNSIEHHYSIPENVRTILKTSCYDCHSNNTVYPWYSKIQPVKWLLAKHIKDGKDELNFDEFNNYPTKRKLHKLEEIVENIKNDNMPLKPYTLLHSNTKLSVSDKAEIEAWVNDLQQEIQ